MIMTFKAHSNSKSKVAFLQSLRQNLKKKYKSDEILYVNSRIALILDISIGIRVLYIQAAPMKTEI